MRPLVKGLAASVRADEIRLVELLVEVKCLAVMVSASDDEIRLVDLQRSNASPARGTVAVATSTIALLPPPKRRLELLVF